MTCLTGIQQPAPGSALAAKQRLLPQHHVHLLYHTAPGSVLQCYCTSTEAVQTIRDGEPRMSTSSFTDSSWARPQLPLEWPHLTWEATVSAETFGGNCLQASGTSGKASPAAVKSSLALRLTEPLNVQRKGRARPRENCPQFPASSFLRALPPAVLLSCNLRVP